MPDAGHASTRRWIAADGVALVGDTLGDAAAPAVILLHGGGQTRHAWAAAAKRLSESGFYVIAYDLRGHGDSGWSPDSVYSFSRHARDLDVVMRDVQGPTALVGASMGGLSALCAVTQGARPQALVLVDIVLQPEPTGVARIRRFMLGNPQGFATLSEAADAVAAYNPHRKRPKSPQGLLKNLRLRNDGRYYWHWDPRVIAQDWDTEMLEITGMESALRAGPILPTLLVRGANSDVVSDANVRSFREIMPHLEVREIAETGHMVAGDSNDNFVVAIRRFLAANMLRK